MKKKLLILILLMFTVTGCTNVSNMEFSAVIPFILNRNNQLYNVVFDGYKYYVPKGLKFVTKNDYNAILLDSKNNRYYLYVDVVSFYNEVKLDYHENTNAYYSSKLDYDSKEGYLEITETDESDYYFIEYMYHYGKMEAYIQKEDMKDVIIYMSSLLSSLQFNRTVLETLIGNNVLNYKEEVFDVMKPKGNNATKDTYLDYVEKYDTYDGYSQSDLDEDNIDINEIE